MAVTHGKAKAIRRACFARKLPLNRGLTAAARELPGHAFLTNPASQNVYLYLVDYVKHLSASWWGRGIEDLRLLDWGCGRGHVTLLLREMGADVTACDVAAGVAGPLVERAGQGVIALEHDYVLPFEGGRFDVVVSFGVLEHVASDIDSLGEIRRVLKDAGLLFCFYVPYFLSWTQRLMRLRGSTYHDRLYSKRRIGRLAERAGFDILDIWHRQLLPKIRLRYPCYRIFESMDQFLTNYSLLKYLATNIEFVACKK